MQTGHLFHFGEFVVDPSSRTLLRHQVAVPLHRRSFDVLLYLIQNPGRVVTKEELLHSVWPEANVEENNLAQSMSALRRALEDRRGVGCLIATLPGRGYQFTAAVQSVASAQSFAALNPAPLEPAAASNGVHAHGVMAYLLQERTVTTSVLTQEHEEAHEAAHGGGDAQLAERHALPGRAAGSLLRSLLIVVALAGAAALGYIGWRRLHPMPTSATVVLADFTNSTGDPAFDHTLNLALEIDLSQSPYMDVMSERELVEALQYMGRKGDAVMDADLARQVCERSNRDAVLHGSIAPVGKDYLLTLVATDCRTGAQLASAKAEAATKERVVSTLDAMTDRVRRKLGESTQSRESYRVPIVKATTTSLEALRVYSIGSYMEAQGKTEPEVLPLYLRAAELDPNFAMAYSAIGTQYYNLSEFKLATQFYRKAWELSGNVSAKEKLTIQAHYFAEGQQDLEQGIKVYQLWAATYPRDWIPWLDLANEYTQIGQYGPAVEAGRHALQLEPDRVINYSVLARAYKRANRAADAKALGALAIQRGKDGIGLHGTLYTLSWQQQDHDALARETAWGEAHGGWYAHYLEALAAASEGRLRQARDDFDAAVSEAREEGLPESADEMLMDQADIEQWFGLPALARATLATIGKADADSFDVNLLRAKMGDTAGAEAFLSAHAGIQTGTLLTYLQLPRLRAAVACARGNLMESVAALDSATPYQLAGYDVLTERGESYLKAHQGTAAAAQFEKLLANPGISFGPQYPLAHLHLARAYAMQGRQQAARTEYRSFLSAWQAADQDLPVLRAARSELSALR